MLTVKVPLNKVTYYLTCISNVLICTQSVNINLYVQGLLEKFGDKVIDGNIAVYFVGWRMIY